MMMDDDDRNFAIRDVYIYTPGYHDQFVIMLNIISNIYIDSSSSYNNQFDIFLIIMPQAH